MKVEFVPTCYGAVKNNLGGFPSFLLFAGGAEGFLLEHWVSWPPSEGVSSSQHLKCVL